MNLTLKGPQKAHSRYINENCVSLQHEDNYQLLNVLLPAKLIENKCYQSSHTTKPKLQICVINKYKYTTEVEFNYLFQFGSSEKITIKLYHDAKVAELVHCTNVQKFIRLLGPKIALKVHCETRSTLNKFLNKWLNFLLKNGYSQSFF